MTQEQLENEIMDLSIGRYRDRVVKNQQRGMETLNPSGKRAMSMAVEAVGKGVVAWLERGDSQPGPKASAANYLRKIDPYVAAVYALRTVIDGISQSHTLTNVAVHVGNALQHEVTIGQMRESVFKGVERNLKKSPLAINRRVRREQYLRAAKKFGERMENWPHADRMRVGSVMVDIIIETTGWIELIKVQGRRRGFVYQVKSTPAFQQMMAEYNQTDESLHPMFVPMIEQPLDWETMWGGGYYTPRMQRPVIKFRGRGHRDRLAKVDLEKPLNALNAMQKTPWQVNKRVLDVVKELWASGKEVAGLPPRYDRVPPTKPNFETHRQEWIEWKKNAGDIFRRNRKDDSVRVQVVRTLWVADKFTEYEKFYFPYQFDFRGRMYAMPQLLNPQGSDLAKGLLMFAEAKPIGEDGVQWLAVHLANTYGEDKVSFADRRKWVDDNDTRILRVADDPLNELWWAEADKPFQFLAAAFAWADYRRHGVDIVCGLPVYFDGSANGLQHFSAMLRDEVCGPLVNLTPQPRPADLYQSVADTVNARLVSDAGSGVVSGDVDQWRRFGIDRSAVKRPVMVLPYGGTKDSTLKYLNEWYLEKVDAGQAPIPEANKALRLLANVVWESMAETTAGARRAMDWLRAAARAVGKKPIVWTTPSGFVAYQAYADLRKYRVKTKIGDTVLQSIVSIEQPTLDKRKQAQAFAPNFVHSYDAAALVATVNRARQEGITDFSAIHDSFGTLPADAGKLIRILREEFYNQYADRNPLADLAKELGVEEPLPALGTLDLSEVLSSPFLFS